MVCITFWERGEAIEITGDMLRFNASESRQVLDVGLDESERDALAERTEGWPVALQLARVITLQGQSDPFALTHLMSRGGHLWSFLSDQVLRGLSEEAVDFLLETSILERFSAESPIRCGAGVIVGASWSSWNRCNRC